MKKINMFWIIPVFMVMIGFLHALPAQAQAAATLTIITPTGEKLDGGTLLITKGKLMLPLRQLAKATNSQFHVASNGKVTLAPWAGEVYTFKLGQREYKFNQQQGTSQMPAPVQKMNGQVYIPAAFIQYLGYNYTYSKPTLTIQMPLSAKQRQILYKGDLAAARELITSGGLPIPIPGNHSLQQPLQVKSDGESLDREYLFPEGEALRFYYVYGDTISFVEFKNDFPVITWQAHGLSAATGDFHTMNDLLTFQLKDKWGNIPLKNQNFLYYIHGGWGDSNLIESGILHADNSFHRTGRVYIVGGGISDQSGTISYTLPNEKRTDARSY